MNVPVWLPWALASASFAALTAIFAKIGLDGVDSDLATFIRIVVLVVVVGCFVALTGKWRNPFELSGRSLTFLVLSALATGASWLAYFHALKVGPAAKVAPVDKLSVVLVAIFAVAFLGERPSLRAWSGIGLIAIGVTILSLG